MGHPFKHFKTITKHRHAVIRHCAKCGILWQGFFHDLSKYTPTEFIVGSRNYLGSKSPNEAERQQNGYSLAWMHHKGRNKHHFEYWTDYNPTTKRIEPVEMPLNYVVEMFCDRVAASKIYNEKTYNENMPIEYFLKAKSRRIINENTSNLLESWLLMLQEKGEDETFKYIKGLVKNKK
ncbi:MAG: catalase [Ruminococcaceae bacterium]|nr:catalase [Oscillospiraceae bacterium]